MITSDTFYWFLSLGLQKSYSEVRGHSLSLHVGGLSGVMCGVSGALRLCKQNIQHDENM